MSLEMAEEWGQRNGGSLDYCIHSVVKPPLLSLFIETFKIAHALEQNKDG
jgi:hypothetical protein